MWETAGGEHERDLGICPATVDKRLDGVHVGTNAKRACWILTGTMCSEKIQSSFPKKYENCEQCDFYKTLKGEQGPSYELAIVLLKKLSHIGVSRLYHCDAAIPLDGVIRRHY